MTAARIAGRMTSDGQPSLPLPPPPPGVRAVRVRPARALLRLAAHHPPRLVLLLPGGRRDPRGNEKPLAGRDGHRRPEGGGPRPVPRPPPAAGALPRRPTPAGGRRRAGRRPRALA